MISNLNTVAAREIARDFARRAVGRHATQKRDEPPAYQAGGIGRPVDVSLSAERTNAQLNRRRTRHHHAARARIGA